MPTDILDALEAAHQAAKLDPLESTRIISPGYEHMANLTEILVGRARCVGMMPKEWADYLAALDNARPALLAVAQKARDISLSGMEPDDERLDYYTVQIDKREWEALRAALAALESPEGGRE